MRILVSAGMLLALAAPSFALDPNRNRMNNPYPETVTHEAVDRAPTGMEEPSPFANRMNVEYGEKASAEMPGGPDPFANRMNAPAPEPVTTPEDVPEQKPVR